MVSPDSLYFSNRPTSAHVALLNERLETTAVEERQRRVFIL